MVETNLVGEARHEPPYRLGGHGNFRHHHQHLAPLFQHLRGCPQVDLGLTGTGYAVQQERLLVRLPQAWLDLLPDFFLVSREGWDDVRLHLDLLQRVAPDFGLVEVQQTRFGEHLQISIGCTSLGIDPREINREGFLSQKIQHLFPPLPGGVIFSKLLKSEGFDGGRC